MLRLLVVGFDQALRQLVTICHMSVSRLFHLFADPGDLSIGFLLGSVTGSHILIYFGLQMFDHGGLVDPVGQRLSKGLDCFASSS